MDTEAEKKLTIHRKKLEDLLEKTKQEEETLHKRICIRDNALKNSQKKLEALNRPLQERPVKTSVDRNDLLEEVALQTQNTEEFLNHLHNITNVPSTKAIGKILNNHCNLVDTASMYNVLRNNIESRQEISNNPRPDIFPNAGKWYRENIKRIQSRVHNYDCSIQGEEKDTHLMQDQEKSSIPELTLDFFLKIARKPHGPFKPCVMDKMCIANAHDAPNESFCVMGYVTPIEYMMILNGKKEAPEDSFCVFCLINMVCMNYETNKNVYQLTTRISDKEETSRPLGVPFTFKVAPGHFSFDAMLKPCDITSPCTFYFLKMNSINQFISISSPVDPDVLRYMKAKDPSLSEMTVSSFYPPSDMLFCHRSRHTKPLMTSIAPNDHLIATFDNVPTIENLLRQNMALYYHSFTSLFEIVFQPFSETVKRLRETDPNDLFTWFPPVMTDEEREHCTEYKWRAQTFPFNYSFFNMELPYDSSSYQKTHAAYWALHLRINVAVLLYLRFENVELATIAGCARAVRERQQMPRFDKSRVVMGAATGFGTEYPDKRFVEKEFLLREQLECFINAHENIMKWFKVCNVVKTSCSDDILEQPEFCELLQCRVDGPVSASDINRMKVTFTQYCYPSPSRKLINYHNDVVSEDVFGDLRDNTVRFVRDIIDVYGKDGAIKLIQVSGGEKGTWNPALPLSTVLETPRAYSILIALMIRLNAAQACKLRLFRILEERMFPNTPYEIKYTGILSVKYDWYLVVKQPSFVSRIYKFIQSNDETGFCEWCKSNDAFSKMAVQEYQTIEACFQEIYAFFRKTKKAADMLYQAHIFMLNHQALVMYMEDNNAWTDVLLTSVPRHTEHLLSPLMVVYPYPQAMHEGDLPDVRKAVEDMGFLSRNSYSDGKLEKLLGKATPRVCNPRKFCNCLVRLIFPYYSVKEKKKWQTLCSTIIDIEKMLEESQAELKKDLSGKDNILIKEKVKTLQKTLQDNVKTRNQIDVRLRQADLGFARFIEMLLLATLTGLYRHGESVVFKSAVKATRYVKNLFSFIDNDKSTVIVEKEQQDKLISMFTAYESFFIYMMREFIFFTLLHHPNHKKIIMALYPYWTESEQDAVYHCNITRIKLNEGIEVEEAIKEEERKKTQPPVFRIGTDDFIRAMRGWLKEYEKNKTKQSICFPLAESWKISAADTILNKTNPGDPIDPMWLREIGVSEEGNKVVWECADRYSNNHAYPQISKLLSEKLPLHDFKIVNYFFVRFMLINNIQIVQLQDELRLKQLEAIHYRYLIHPEEDLPENSYTVHIPICCNNSKTSHAETNGIQSTGQNKVTYDRFNNIYPCWNKTNCSKKNQEKTNFCKDDLTLSLCGSFPHIRIHVLEKYIKVSRYMDGLINDIYMICPRCGATGSLNRKTLDVFGITCGVCDLGERTVYSDPMCIGCSWGRSNIIVLEKKKRKKKSKRAPDPMIENAELEVDEEGNVRNHEIAEKAVKELQKKKKRKLNVNEIDNDNDDRRPCSTVVTMDDTSEGGFLYHSIAACHRHSAAFQGESCVQGMSATQLQSLCQHPNPNIVTSQRYEKHLNDSFYTILNNAITYGIASKDRTLYD